MDYTWNFEAQKYKTLHHMYKVWHKRDYLKILHIDWERQKYVADYDMNWKIIHSYCRWITHETQRHRSTRHSTICTKYGTKQFTLNILNIDWERHKYMADYDMNWKILSSKYQVSDYYTGVSAKTSIWPKNGKHLADPDFMPGPRWIGWHLSGAEQLLAGFYTEI